MGLVQLVAENADNLAELRNEQAREIMQPIAGKFMVHRFEFSITIRFGVLLLLRYSVSLTATTSTINLTKIRSKATESN